MPCDFTCANDPDNTSFVRVSNNQYAVPLRHPDRDEAAFGLGMIRVGICTSERIFQHRHSLPEIDSMFLEIGSSLVGVPFEDHKSSLVNWAV